MKNMRSKRHLTTLDFLRGIAALFVVLFHFSGTGLSKLMQEPIRQMFSWGYLGVIIFFVISGFVIPYALLRSNYRFSDFGNFIGKRFVRICPPSYIVILLTLVLFYTIDRLHLSKNSWFGLITFPQVIHNFLYTIPFTNYEWINGVFWTLAIEFQFYLFIGLVFIQMFKTLTNFAICSLVLTCFYYTPLAQPIQFFHYNSFFIIGGITLLYFEKRIFVSHYLFMLSVIGAICYFQIGLTEALFGVATSLTIAFTHVDNRIGKFLGNISYSLYLTHMLIGSACEAFLIKFFPPTTPIIKFVLFVTILLIAIIGAYIYNILAETFFINLANKFFGRKKTGANRLVREPNLVAVNS